MPAIEINATLVTCLVDIQAKAGDLLLIYGDNCLGVYRGVTKVPETRFTAAPPFPSNGIDKPELGFSEKDIQAALTIRPMNARDVGDALNIARTDAYRRRYISEMVRRLAKIGVLRARPGTKTQHYYEVVPHHERAHKDAEATAG